MAPTDRPMNSAATALLTNARYTHRHASSPILSTEAQVNHSLYDALRMRMSRSKADAIAKMEKKPRQAAGEIEFRAAPATRRPGVHPSRLHSGSHTRANDESDRPVMHDFTATSTEPPPAYSPRTQEVPIKCSAADVDASSPCLVAGGPCSDDSYAFLSSFDTWFVIDDSNSMVGRSWCECLAALEAITPICTGRDEDGIDIFFLNFPDSPRFRGVKHASTVREIFEQVRPSGCTPTGQTLHRILRDYLGRLEQHPASTKPLNVIVVTDGVPSDDVESVIISVAKRLDELHAIPWQIGIQFFQIGNEVGAREHLEGLDDELVSMGGGCRDIVDTVPFKVGPRGQGTALSAEGILKVVLGAVNKRLDRQQNM